MDLYSRKIVSAYADTRIIPEEFLWMGTTSCFMVKKMIEQQEKQMAVIVQNDLFVFIQMTRAVHPHVTLRSGRTSISID